ncbi:toxin-antitoxin system HicB family antitoxin [Micromonospora sp. WMMD812]|uniref:toxin-antitoxin system HicB family antitoxin n=1 Tax=Micromonospora sp. WMMD812 TaxID=3015152 RepID=UPI00248B7FD1|nr:toxin-antitoxin system HicB family antitoxin [Micromonospora sp. WMMD812]WBB68413.1 toxin-antitoxin system HicB family antitoxin [Micromonospora sp. WMMD812]
MELRAYVDAVRHDLAVAAAAGGDEARELAERLTAPLESAIRLALLDALSEAATEITRDLAPGSVDLRLRNREPSFVVTPPPADQWADEPEAPPAPIPPVNPLPPAPADGEDEATVRISLRLPEHLKARVEHSAAAAGVSINTWLIRAAAAAVGAGDLNRRSETRRTSGAATGGQRFTGWVR